MNHYKNLIKLVKPEYQPHYYLQKKVNGENKFGLFFKRPDYKKGNSNGVLILDVRNSQNLIEVHKKGENPYISDCSYIWNEELYKQLDIPDAVSDFIYYLVDSNNRKNYFYLFFYDIPNPAAIPSPNLLPVVATTMPAFTSSLSSAIPLAWYYLSRASL